MYVYIEIPPKRTASEKTGEIHKIFLSLCTAIVNTAIRRSFGIQPLYLQYLHRIYTQYRCTLYFILYIIKNVVTQSWLTPVEESLFFLTHTACSTLENNQNGNKLKIIHSKHDSGQTKTSLVDEQFLTSDCQRCGQSK